MNSPPFLDLLIKIRLSSSQSSTDRSRQVIREKLSLDGFHHHFFETCNLVKRKCNALFISAEAGAGRGA